MSDALIEAVARAILDARYQRDNARLNMNMTWDKLDDNAHDVYRAQARAALAELEASGTHVVMPTKPMPEMLGAWYRYKNGFHFQDEPQPDDTSDVGAYAAMIAARPKVTE